MKIKYQILNITYFDRCRLESEHETEEECIKIIENTPKDLKGTVIYTIRKVWTNSRN